MGRALGAHRLIQSGTVGEGTMVRVPNKDKDELRQIWSRQDRWRKSKGLLQLTEAEVEALVDQAKAQARIERTKRTLVTDTNLWVSALLGDGPSRRVVEFCLSKSVLFSFTQMLDEIAEVFNIIKQRNLVSPASADELIARLVKHAVVLPLPDRIARVCADPEADIFFACASEASADFLISSDPPILAVKSYQGTKVIKTADFVRLMSSNRNKATNWNCWPSLIDTSDRNVRLQNNNDQPR